MSGKKTAALTGVLYYLFEEVQESAENNRNNCCTGGIPAWAFVGRTISAGQRRILQGRKFSSSLAKPQDQAAPGTGGPLSTKAGKAAALNRWKLGCAAGRRNLRDDYRKVRS